MFMLLYIIANREHSLYLQVKSLFKSHMYSHLEALEGKCKHENKAKIPIKNRGQIQHIGRKSKKKNNEANVYSAQYR